MKVSNYVQLALLFRVPGGNREEQVSEKNHYHDSEEAKRKRKGPGSHNSLQWHIPSDLKISL
jgi:hypothetical protein